MKKNISSYAEIYFVFIALVISALYILFCQIT